MLRILSDITPHYYCFWCLSYQIKPHIITVSFAIHIRYIPTILLFLFPVLPDITPNNDISIASLSDISTQSYFSCSISYHIKPQNNIVSVACPIRYKTTILLFVLRVLSDIIWQYYWFRSMSYRIYRHINSVSVAFPNRYTTTIILFVFPVLSNTPPQYYCFWCLSYQIKKHNNNISVAYPITYTSKYYCLFCLNQQI